MAAMFFEEPPIDGWDGALCATSEERQCQAIDGRPEWHGYGAKFKKRGPASQQRLGVGKGTPEASSVFVDRRVPQAYAPVHIDIDTYIVIAGKMPDGAISDVQ